MNRRSILKSLGILPLGLLTPKFVAANNESKELRIGDTIFTCEEYKGFKYFWTGWKQTSDSLRIVGQWIAVNPKAEINIYSSYPGRSGQFLKGQCLNTTPTNPQHFMEVTCRQEVKDSSKNHALITLIKEVDKYYEELKNPPKEPEYRFGFTGFKNARIYGIGA